jgi:hypothetical protein
MKIDEIKTIIARTGEILKPKENWPPLIGLSREDAEKKIILIPPQLMNSEDGKDIAAQFISEAIRINRATRCAMVATAWLTIPDSGKKHEIVMLLYCDGPRQIAELHYASVLRRHKLHPGLAAWCSIPDATPGGRFLEAIMPALSGLSRAA